ncbi:hypothetical protein [Spirosoma areae]
MRQTLVILAVIMGSLASLFLYCAALIDWVQDYRTGIYAKDYTEAVVETSAIFIYSYTGYRFLRWRTAH